MPSNYIAIDIGTENIRIADAGNGRILSEPALVALSSENDGMVCAVGEEAKELVQRVPGRYIGIKPMKNGMVADYNMLRILLSEMIRKNKKGFSLIQPKAVAAVPSGLSDMHKRELEDVIKASGVRDVILMDAPMAGCIGMGEDVSEATAKMLISVGAGIAEIAVICMDRMVAYKMSGFAGNYYDEMIAQKIRRELDLWIGGSIAEALKKKIGLRDPGDLEMLCGKNVITGLPMMASMNSREISGTLNIPVGELIEAVREMIYNLPEEIVKDINRSGILLIGGSINMKGLSERISQELDLPVRTSASPENAVINGTLHMAMELNGFRERRGFGRELRQSLNE